MKFAELLGMKYDTLRSWEGGYKSPSSPGRALLYTAEKLPEVFLKNREQIINQIKQNLNSN
ncbi:MAG: helix-turn-helix domain-containing protein [Janthinobacterium lividum]